MNYILFFTAFIGVFILLNMYISKRLVAKLDISPKIKRYLRIFLIINLIGILCYMLARYYVDTPSWLYFLFSVPIGVLFLLFWSAVVYDISRVILSFAPISQERRNFLKKSLDVASVAAAATLTLKSIYNAKFVEIQKVDVEIKNLKKPYKIVQLSDLHIGGLIEREFIEEIVQKANALNPDIVVITGDLIDVDVLGAKKTLAELIKLNAQMYTSLGLVQDGFEFSKLLSSYIFENLKYSENRDFQEKNIIQNNIANLTYQEQNYLKEKKIITACVDPDWMPFESLKEGKHIGLSADYLDIFQKNLSVAIKVVKTDSWMDSLELAKMRKCDILPLAMETNERKEYLDFTSPYLKIPVVLATKHDVAFIADFNNLGNKKIGIPKGYSYNEILKKRYPDLNIVDVKNVKDGLEKVRRGELFGYIGTLASVGYFLQKEFFGELKITGKFDEMWELGIGVRNDDPVLLKILEKAIFSISEDEKQNILNKWVSIKYENDIDYSLIWKVLALAIFIALGATYWIRKLSILNKELKNAREKAEEATKIKSNFLANMSHEIRTPMNSIVSMTYLIKKNVTTQPLIHYVQMIENASNNLLLLLNDILDLSKIEAKKMQINKTEFYLIEVLDSINNLTKIKAQEKGLAFEIIYDKSDAMYVRGDSLRLMQILSNLSLNAVKFTQDGYVKIYVEKVAENRFRFTISDTGIGLTQDQIEKLFDSFTQADESITRKYGGTGLGLAICKELVALMQGKIWVESTFGQGSRFIFEVTLQEVAPILENKIKSDTHNLAQKKIKNTLHIDKEHRDALFLKLKNAVTSRRPKTCEPIISEIERYVLEDEDDIVFEKVKRLVQKYQFNEAMEILNAQ